MAHQGMKAEAQPGRGEVRPNQTLHLTRPAWRLSCREYAVPVTAEERRRIEAQGRDAELAGRRLWRGQGPWWARRCRPTARQSRSWPPDDNLDDSPLTMANGLYSTLT